MPPLLSHIIHNLFRDFKDETLTENGEEVIVPSTNND